MNILIVGGNRGIGLALVHEYLSQGHTVYATCRSSQGALAGTNARVIEHVDVTQDAGATALKVALEGVTLNQVIINAGVLYRDTLDSVSFDDIRHQLEVNAIGPLRIARALLSNVASGSKIGIVTSRMGSITDNTSGSYYGYRMSKAAVNSVGASLANDLAPRGVSVALLHPGFVKTEMTGGNGEVAPEFSAKGLMMRMTELSLDTSGGFWHAQGEPLPW